jgi:biotin transporter BioY
MERIAGRRRRVGVLSWGSNPLRRKVDRIEAGIFAGLLVMFLIGAPLLVVAAGWWEHGAAVAEQRAQRSVHLVTAVLLQDVPDIVAGTGALDAGALARWTASDGKSCVGLVLDTAGARAGSRLLIWVDGSGRQADPPLTRHGVRSRVITAAALALAAFAITLLAVAIWLRWLLNCRRLAGWGAAWADIGPR